MTDAEWFSGTGAKLRHIERYASVRKMRLIAAAYVRRLEQVSHDDEPKRCDDLIEAGADHPRPWTELEPELDARPGNWRYTHVLFHDAPARVAMALRKLVMMWPFAEYQSFTEGLISEVIGNPFRPAAFEPDWRTSTVAALAEGIYADRGFDRLPILADALEDGGCNHPDILTHCRGAGPHVRGCWVVDLVLGKE